ncbi:uncharacterized protein LOC142974454 [Anticarsia gemmatalis]|uniref:uncharacterized protein LOC142974454 n=1 Tax=Anticarsia gemmatalis TaxID=129554 RepID=UPI003F76C07F
MEIVMEEEDIVKPEPEPEPIYLCKCLLDSESSEKVVMPERKKNILSTVARTEEYLRERRIPELIRFLLTSVIAHGPSMPVAFLETLLDDCMLFRAGHGKAPVLYEDRHLQAVVKSFDPGNRGWLSSGQVRRAFTTLGITPKNNLEERVSTDEVFCVLKQCQESQLFHLLSAGTNIADGSSCDDANSSDSI